MTKATPSVGMLISTANEVVNDLVVSMVVVDQAQPAC
jgi:hypothetical protein